MQEGPMSIREIMNSIVPISRFNRGKSVKYLMKWSSVA